MTDIYPPFQAWKGILSSNFEGSISDWNHELRGYSKSLAFAHGGLFFSFFQDFVLFKKPLSGNLGFEQYGCFTLYKFVVSWFLFFFKTGVYQFNAKFHYYLNLTVEFFSSLQNFLQGKYKK